MKAEEERKGVRRVGQKLQGELWGKKEEGVLRP